MAEPIGPGVFIAVVGPSGVGKDSVIRYARERLEDRSDILFVQRVVTRPMDAASEVHDSLSTEDFDRARRSGAFAVSWEAHGHCYGLPGEVDRWIGAGSAVVANVSRQVLSEIERRYFRVKCVSITARREVIAGRLLARGREDGTAVMDRLGRPALPITAANFEAIDNSGPLSLAGERFVDAILSAMQQGQTADRLR